MGAWAPLLLLVGGGATLAFAATRKKKKGKGPAPTPGPLPTPPGGPGKPYTLDANLPEPLLDQVLAALATEKDPDRLDTFANTLAMTYPKSAAALRAKAAALRAHEFVLPPNPLDLLTGIPDPPRGPVVTMLMTVNVPSVLEQYASQVEVTFPQHPRAAAALRLKALLLRAQQQPSPSPQPGPIPPEPPPIVPGPMPQPPAPVPQPVPAPPIGWPTPPLPTPPPPVPVPVPVPSPVPPPPVPAPPPPLPTPSPTPAPQWPPGLPSLDPNMPHEMQLAVLGSLTSENDPAKLQGFASQIQGQYPIAAGLLMAKANALLLMRGGPLPPAPSPIPAPPIVLPQPPAPPAPPPLVALYPIGDDSTRTGRNAGRPVGKYPFVVLGTQGPGNAPITIAKYGSGHEENWPQLKAMNPQYRFGVDPEWVGQALNVPWEWAPALVTAQYAVKQDPGATPPAGALTPIRNALPAGGGTHVANA